MPEISSQEAISHAQHATNVPTGALAQVWYVRRLDGVENYYLVVFGQPDSAIAVAAVGVEQGEVQSWARLPGSNGHLLLDRNQAAEKAGSPSSQPELVWQPCQASRSLLYPLWKIQTPDKVVYVDQQGRVWSKLGFDRPGG